MSRRAYSSSDPERDVSRAMAPMTAAVMMSFAIIIG